MLLLFNPSSTTFSSYLKIGYDNPDYWITRMCYPNLGILITCRPWWMSIESHFILSCRETLSSKILLWRLYWIENNFFLKLGRIATIKTQHGLHHDLPTADWLYLTTWKTDKAEKEIGVGQICVESAISNRNTSLWRPVVAIVIEFSIG